MPKMDLSKYGIKSVKEVLYNPTYEVLYNEETKPELEGYEKGHVTELGAINVMTGIYTGRSPKDKYIVMDKNSKDTVWWNTPEYPNDNHPMSEKVWKVVKKTAQQELSGKRLFVVDGFCGTHKDTRMKVRFIMEVAKNNCGLVMPGCQPVYNPMFGQWLYKNKKRDVSGYCSNDKKNDR